MKVVINKCFGGFSISIEALQELVKRNANCVKTRIPKTYYGGDNEKYRGKSEWEQSWKKDFSDYTDLGNGMWGHKSAFNILKDGLLYSLDDRSKNSMRTDKDLIEVVETMGEKANGMCASLKIVEIPDDISWEIDEYDGMEKINETHNSWS